MKKCEICQKEFESGAGLAGHLKKQHKMKMSDYVVQTKYDGKQPKCPECGEETKFYRGKNDFSPFCSKHANLSRSKWSKEHKTFDFGWKKGLTKHDHPGILAQSQKISGENNPMFGKTHPPEVLKAAVEKRVPKLFLSLEEFQERKKKLLSKFEIISPYETFRNGSGVKELLDVRCVKCDKIQKKNLWSLQHEWSLCVYCGQGTSNGENEVLEFVRSLGVDGIRNSRTIIPPQELDIFIPEKNVAIEFNGLYFHSELFKEKNYHSKKWKECLAKNVKLIQFFSDEWENKQEIVKSMIKHRLGKTDNVIFARKCEVREVEGKIAREFFQRTHIGGKPSLKNAFGLFFNDQMVACIGLRVPIQKKYGNVVEIARFSTELNCNVVGGFSKILKVVEKWAKEKEFVGILTYADGRFGSGNLYEKNGFDLLGFSPPDYWYTNCEKREFRFKYRAQPGKTEQEVADENGVLKIYGTGSKQFLRKI